jgi:predicted nucleotidyltransferase
MDEMEAKLCRLLKHFATHGFDLTQMGLTGSLLIQAHTPSSDFDLVAYTRSHFCGARDIVQQCLAHGAFTDLDEAAWRDAYRRRGCSLSYEEFLWHEQRKRNKALFEGTKFDLSLVTTDPTPPAIRWRKLGAITLRALVLDASGAFDYPARYSLEHPEIDEIAVFTHTYVGQAIEGEIVEAVGQIECNTEGRRRLVVGSSREAPGEYIRVLRPASSA